MENYNTKGVVDKEQHITPQLSPDLSKDSIGRVCLSDMSEEELATEGIFFNGETIEMLDCNATFYREENKRCIKLTSKKDGTIISYGTLWRF